MKVENILLPVCAENCYLAINEKLNQSIIIDPGSAEDRIYAAVEASKTKPVAILLTHGHFDHAGVSLEVSQHYQVKIYAALAEKDTLENPMLNLSQAFIGQSVSYKADVYLKDEEEIDLAGMHIRCLYTPGHTAGGCSYYFSYEGVCFTGDTLFHGSVGRTDFPGGSMSGIVRSIKEKLMVLPDDTICYPGHDSVTTIDQERMYNPYIY